MINDLDLPGFELWKYVDDSTISETILKGQASEHPDRCRHVCFARCFRQVPAERDEVQGNEDLFQYKGDSRTRSYCY